MNVILTKLTLNNYRNIENQQLEFDGSSKIIGENRIGKTNTIEALCWLLTDKLLNGGTDIDQIKPLDDTKKKVRVEGIFQIGEKEVTYAKEYYENWVKTRGTSDLELKGNTTDYFYNGAKLPTKKGFESLLAADLGLTDVWNKYQGIDIIQLLINPLYLGRMGDGNEWKNLRALIISIVGDVQDSDVFNLYPETRAIEKDLSLMNGKTDLVCIDYRNKHKTIEEQIIGDDAVIQNLESKPKPDEELKETYKKALAECDENIRQLQSGAVDDKATMVIEDEILKIRNQIINLKQKDFERKSESLGFAENNALATEKSEIYKEIQDAIIKKNKVSSELDIYKRDKEGAEREFNDLSAQRLNLLDRVKAMDNQLENLQVETECPHCHRPYPEDEIEKRTEEARKNVELNKFAVISDGKKIAEKRNTAKDTIVEKDKLMQGCQMEIDRLEQSLTLLQSRLSEVEKKMESCKGVEFKPNPEIAKLEEEIHKKEMEKVEIRNSIFQREESVRSLIAAEQAKKENIQKELNEYDFYERTQIELANAKKTKSEHGAALIEIEQKLELAKIFVKRKLEMLNDNVSKVFSDIKFQLIEPQINGGYATVCKPYIKGTNTLWKSGSKSEQLTTGVAICERIKMALGLPNLPFIFDEGGEVSSATFADRFETESQLICVQVRDNIMKPTVYKI